MLTFLIRAVKQNYFKDKILDSKKKTKKNWKNYKHLIRKKTITTTIINDLQQQGSDE